MKTPIFILCLFFSLISRAQLDTISHVNQVIRDMIVYDNKLFIGGNFTTLQDTIQSFWSTYYNGTQMVRQPAQIGGGGVREFAVFNNELYAVGDFNWPFSSNMGVVKWNGSTWIQDEGTNWSHDDLMVDGNYLYEVSSNNIIRRKTAGGSFQVFKDFSGANVSIHEIISYQGKIYIMGVFTEVEGVPARNIAAWNGTAWEALGTGIGTVAYKALVYQNELYVSGSFDEAGGNPSKRIAKWNGTTWSDVGGSVTGNSWNGIRDLIPCGNLLFAVGDFDGIGGETANDIASWDGLQWTTYNFPHSESILGSGAEYNGRLYFGGWDFTRSNLYGYTGNFLALQEYATTPVEAYPNPSNGLFQLSDDYQGTPYEIRNALGQLIGTGTSPEINLSEQQRGVYLLQFVGRDSEVIRLVRE
ncbi:MAG: T9SS type A sorting domain-containing protein [Fluviicola sp.]